MEQTEGDNRRQLAVIIHTIILVSATVLALTGNSLVFLAFYRNRRLRTVTNLYVLSLAVSDIMMATFSFPYHAIASGLRRWPFSYNFCQFTGFVVQYWAQLSVFILALASLNRYFCVVRPNRYSTLFTRKKTIFSILLLWTVLFLQSLIYIFATPIIYRWSPNSLYCRATISDSFAERISYVVFGCLFILPFSFVIFCYSSVYRIIKTHNTVIVPSLQEANSHGTLRAQEIKTSQVIFAAVFGFCISWAPTIVIFILEFGFQVFIPPSAQSVYPLFSSVSAWINPLIYGVMNRAMRKEFQDILFCRKD